MYRNGATQRVLRKSMAFGNGRRVVPNVDSIALSIVWLNVGVATVLLFGMKSEKDRVYRLEA